VVQEPEQSVEKSQEVVYQSALGRFDVRPHVEHAEYFTHEIALIELKYYTLEYNYDVDGPVRFAGDLPELFLEKIDVPHFADFGHREFELVLAHFVRLRR
jgi:hypothetical protein